MPPMFLIEPDEILSLFVGSLPLPLADGTLPEDDRTVFFFQRVPDSKRRQVQAAFTERGVIDMPSYNRALIAIGLTGWKHVLGRDVRGAVAEILFPPPPASLSPVILVQSNGTLTNQETARNQQIFAVLEKMPIGVISELLAAIQGTSHEDLEKNYSAQLIASSSLPRPLAATIALTADASVETLAKASLPVMPEG